jgi:exoribonuclease-2
VSTSRKVGNTVTPEDMADLKLLHARATHLRKKRYATAGLEYSTPSSSVHLVQTPPIISENFYDVHSLPSKPRFFSSPEVDYSVPSLSVTSASASTLSATSMIAEYMILAGRSAASFTRKHNIPVPYRGSAKPRAITLPGMPTVTLEEVLAQRDELGNIDPWTLAKANLHFTPGEVGLTPTAHWSMGIGNDGYLRATSPLRRYDDMLVHWQIKSHLASTGGLASDTILKHVKRSDTAARAIKSSSRKAETWWQASVISSRLDGPVRGDETVDLRNGGLKGIIANGTVYSTSGSLNTTPVYLPELGVLTRLPGKGRTGYEPGMEVKVKVTQTVLWPNVLIDVALD